MSVETFDPAQAVTVTEAAQEHFRSQLDKDPNATGVRLSIKESGCTGYMYVVDLVEAGEADDLVLDQVNGVRLYVQRSALGVVQGTVIDYVREGLNRNLSFNNPNVTDECGCGESFSIG